MPEILSLLGRLLETPDGILSADELGELDDSARDALEGMKILTPARTAGHVVCDACYERHVEEVSRVLVAGRPAVFRIRCPDAGWVTVHPDRLRQWKMNVDQLVVLLAAAISKGSPAEIVVPKAAWRLGEVTIAGAAYGLVLAVARESGLAELAAQLGQACPPDKTVLIIAGRGPDERPDFAAVLLLESAFHFDGAAFQLAVARIRSSLRTDLGTLANTFRLRGHFWELTFDGETVFMKDSVGLAYLARMLAEPDRQIPAVSLLAARAGIDPLVASGSSGEILDKAARDDYGKRYVDLQDELAEAKENYDLARTEKLEAEMEQLVATLSSAAGLGRRSRECTDADKVRKSVSMAVSRAIESIAVEHQSLGRHLVAAISSGLTFSYTPSTPVDWLT